MRTALLVLAGLIVVSGGAPMPKRPGFTISAVGSSRAPVSCTPTTDSSAAGPMVSAAPIQICRADSSRYADRSQVPIIEQRTVDPRQCLRICMVQDHLQRRTEMTGGDGQMWSDIDRGTEVATRDTTCIPPDRNSLRRLGVRINIKALTMRAGGPTIRRRPNWPIRRASDRRSRCATRRRDRRRQHQRGAVAELSICAILSCNGCGRGDAPRSVLRDPGKLPFLYAELHLVAFFGLAPLLLLIVPDLCTAALHAVRRQNRRVQCAAGAPARG